LEVSFPIVISVHLINHRSALFAFMPSEIPLSVSFQVQATDCNPALHWLLPDRGVEILASPCGVTWKRDVD
jgi:hypothetical protein